MPVRSVQRRWLFRCLAIGIGLLPFLLAELALRAWDLGKPQSPSTSFESGEQARPLFQLAEDRSRYQIPASRQPFFKTDSFRATKGERDFRIFCFGGSTVQGNPYSIETSFTTWLELSLRAADPTREWEVVNCGGISYASYRLAPIWRECLRYSPDLFILYVGDNEFLEHRSYHSSIEDPSKLNPVLRIGLRSRLVQVVRQLWMSRSSAAISKSRAELSAEVDALLDYQGGLASYHRDHAWRRQVEEGFAITLANMLGSARDAHVPVLLVDPVSNIKDCPPFKVEGDTSLTPEAKRRFEELIETARDPKISHDRRIELLEAARDLDASHAGVQYALGQEYLVAGRDREALAALIRAKDEDVCPLRMSESLRQILYTAARESQTPIVPVWEEFQRLSPRGIPGDELLLDHVHPTISGHQRIANLLLDAMRQQGWVEPLPDWEAKRKEAYQAHLQTLEAPYYARGKEHLEGLRRWTSGRVKKVKTGAIPKLD